MNFHGLSHIRDKGDHEMWNDPKCPMKRPVVIQGGKHKEIADFHIGTNLRTMGLSRKDLNTWQINPDKAKKRECDEPVKQKEKKPTPRVTPKTRPDYKKKGKSK